MKVTNILKLVVSRRVKSGNFRSQVSLAAQARTFSTANSVQSSIREEFEIWRAKFQQSGVPEPEDSIKHILSAVTGIPHYEIPDRSDSLEQEKKEQLEALCSCRLARMPVQYIIRNWDFLDLTLSLVPPVFIPRPETESLVLLAEEYLKGLQAPRILEIGSGSGAVTVALAKRMTSLSAVAVDQSSLACNITSQNAAKYNLNDRVEVLKAKLGEDGLSVDDSSPVEFDKLFDLVISNPPYVPQSDLKRLEPDVYLYEDLRALDGGKDGMSVILNILRFAPKWLKPGGKLLLETDHRHPAMLREISSSDKDKFESTGATTSTQYVVCFYQLFPQLIIKSSSLKDPALFTLQFIVF